MKEAAGEANMTVITIILIGVIAAIAIPVVNTAMDNSALKAACNAAGGYMEGSKTCRKNTTETFNCTKNGQEKSYTCS